MINFTNQNKVKKKLAPLALFTYNRLESLKITISYLKKNLLANNSEIYIFSDHWKDISQKKKVLQVRNYINSISGFKKKHIFFRKKNFGLERNIITGITYVVKKKKKIIVIEDDLKLNKFFLTYVNDGLEIYKNALNVASIHGYNYPLNNIKKIPETFFLRGADCWGWGTWERAWKKFEINGRKLLDQIRNKKLESEFNYNGAYNYLKLLENQTKKINQSWAIRWYASAFLNEMLTLYPKRSFVQNIGSSEGTNSYLDLLDIGKEIKKSNHYKIIKKQNPIESSIARKEIEFFLKSKKIYKIKEFLKNLFI
jgi:hypothetical protein